MKCINETWLTDRERPSQKKFLNSNFISCFENVFLRNGSNYENLKWNTPTGTKTRIPISVANRSRFSPFSCVSTEIWMHFITQ